MCFAYSIINLQITTSQKILMDYFDDPFYDFSHSSAFYIIHHHNHNGNNNISYTTSPEHHGVKRTTLLYSSRFFCLFSSLVVVSALAAGSHLPMSARTHTSLVIYATVLDLSGGGHVDLERPVTTRERAGVDDVTVDLRDAVGIVLVGAHQQVRQRVEPHGVVT